MIFAPGGTWKQKSHGAAAEPMASKLSRHGPLLSLPVTSSLLLCLQKEQGRPGPEAKKAKAQKPDLPCCLH
jgi:hypothetical protein